MTALIEKPFSPSCVRNRDIILATLKQQLRATDKHIFEIGSGTGQHAVYMGQNLPHITWQTSDVAENHTGINMWLQEAALKNVIAPIEYEIGCSQLTAKNVDVVFSANIVHIISKALVKRLVLDLGESLESGPRVMFYGPFKYQGEFTAASNADFDLWLKGIDPLRGVRDIEWIDDLMKAQGFVIIDDISMPANNQLLLFEKI